MIEYLKSYFTGVYKTRYFWLHLANWDLKYKFRRSKLGILWTIFQPLFLTIIISVVFGWVFKIPLGEYAPYILSGILVWDVLIGSVVINSNSFLCSEAYMKQFVHPAVIYPLRSSLVTMTTFLIAISALGVWILFSEPENLVVAAFSLPLTLITYFVLAWPISVISSHINLRYRDYPLIMSLVMQALWYVSPVFFQESMFKSNAALNTLFYLNPITHILKLIREPFLYGRLADITSYAYVFLIALIFCILAILINKKLEKEIIFYL